MSCLFQKVLSDEIQNSGVEVVISRSDGKFETVFLSLALIDYALIAAKRVGDA